MFVLFLLAGALVLTATTAGCGARGRVGDRLRLGVFRREPVLIAFYGSAAFDRKLKGMTAEEERAKARGDDERALALEAEGQRIQEVAHRQLAGAATLRNVLEHLGKVLPDVARQAGVAVIVEEPAFAGEAVEVVDVTDLVVRQLPPARPKK